jgi:hypothetical protein
MARFFSTASRPALGPTQPHIQWVPGVLSPELERLEREADHSANLVPMTRMVELYLHSPIRLHAIAQGQLYNIVVIDRKSRRSLQSSVECHEASVLGPA